MQGKNLPHAKPRLDREESLAHFRHIFNDYVGDLADRAPDTGRHWNLRCRQTNRICYPGITIARHRTR
jgi:hypothetical protein